MHTTLPHPSHVPPHTHGHAHAQTPVRAHAPAARRVGSAIDLAGLVRRAVTAMAALEPSRRIDVILHDADEQLPVEPMRIADALGRLLSNACRYSAADTRVRLTSRVEHAHDGDAYVVLSVADRGIGMTPPQLQRAFDVFYRADPGDGRGAGLGLGLGIARDLVEAEGGWITLRSAPGIGTEADLWLPRTALPAPAPAIAIAS